MLGRRITTSGGPNVNPQYEYVDINGDYNLNIEQVDNNTLVTISNTLGSPHIITYGTNLTPLTITLQDGETQTFVFSAVSGWQLHTEEFIENLDHDTRYRIYATSNNTTIQAAGDSLFNIDSKSVDTGNRFIIDNLDGTYTINTEEYPLKVTANFNTIGTGVATRVYYIQEVGQPNGTRVSGAVDGVFGQGSTETPASTIIPKNTTITISVRSVSSGNNQVLNVDSYLDFTQLIDNPTIITNSVGSHRISRHNVVTNLTATIVTGHDLTQAPGMTLKIFFRDQSTDRGWQIVDLDVDNIIETQALSTNDGFGLLFDNDFITVNIVDLVTGEITFTQNGRDFEYVWSELWVTAPTVDGLLPLDNITSFLTTGTFQNLGDANVLFTGANGDRVHVEYGDNNRDVYTIIDGIGKSERKGFDNNDIEIQVITGGQLQIRDVAGVSTVLNAWYEFKDGVVRTTKSIINDDCTIEIDDTGVNQNIKVDPIGINEYINNIEPYYIVLAHEGAGGNSKTVQVNGVGATYQNLLNASDSGNGVISFTSGVNGNFNRRGTTNETITQIGEFFDVITGATGQFDTQWIEISTDPSVQANVFNNNYRIRLTQTSVTVFDKNNATVFTGGTENGTYRFQRTYYGFKISRNDVQIYESPQVIVDYPDLQVDKTSIVQNLNNPSSTEILSTAGIIEVFNSKWFTDSSDQSLWQAGRTTEELANQQTEIFETYLETIVTPTISGVYKFNTSVITSSNAGNDNFRLETVVTGGLINLTKRVSEYEMQDVNGLGANPNILQGGVIVGTVNAGADARIDLHSTQMFTLVAGETYNFQTQWTTQTGDDEGTCYSGLQTVELYKIQ